jgi:predicted nuclease of predicted toxin-antitoxin system
LKFLIDNALSHLLAFHLRNSGHDAVHVRDYRLHAAEDEAVLARADAEGRILVTTDTDFGDLLAGSNGPLIILFRRASGEPDIQFELLRRILEGIGDSLNDGCIVVAEPGKARIRTLPIGESL